jgi:TP901 family phage tail tape measure protein
MDKELKLIIDFIVEVSKDEAKLKKLVSDLQKAFEGIEPEIDIDSEKLQKDIENLGDSLKDLSDTDIELNLDEISNQFDNLEKEIEDVNVDELLDNISLLDDFELDNLTESLSESFDDVDSSKLKSALEEYNKEVAEAKIKLQKFVEENEQTLSLLKAQGKEGTKAYEKIESEIKKAKEQLSKFGDETKDANKQSQDLLSGFAKFGLAFQGLEAVTGIADNFLDAYKEADKQVKNIGTLGVKNLEAIKETAVQVAAETPDTVATVLESLYGGISAGSIEVLEDGTIDLEKSFETVEQASALAVSGMTDANTAMELLASTTNAYGKENLELGDASDITFGIVKNGIAPIEDLAQSMSNVNGIAAAAGVSYEQVAGAMVTLTKQGTPVAQATTQVRSAIAELLKPGASLKKVIDEAGVSLESLKQDGLQETMKKLGVAMETLGTDAANSFSSIESIQFALASTGENAAKAEADLESIRASAGSVEEAFATANEGIGVQAQGILNKVEAAAFGVFDTIGETGVLFLDTASKMTPLIFSFTQLGQVIPTDKLKNFTSSLAKGDFKGFTKGITGAVGGVKKLNVATKLFSASNPFGWIALAAGALTLFLTQTEEGAEILSSFGDKGGELYAQFEPLANFFKQVLGTSLVGIFDLLTEFGAVVFEVISLVADVGITLAEVTGLFDLFGSSTTDAASETDVIIKAVEGFYEVLTFIPKGLKLGIASIRGFVQNAPELLSAFYDVAKAYLNPASWFGDTEAEVEAKARLKAVLQKSFDGAIQGVQTDRANEIFEESLKIKGDLDKENKIGELLEKYQNATTIAEKNNIAKVLSEQNSDIVTSTKYMEDANGKLVESLQINIDKAKELNEANKQAYSDEFSSKQEKFGDNLEFISNRYTQQKEILSDLSSQIIETAKQGGDVSELKSQYDEVEKEISKKSKEIQRQISEATELGFKVTDMELSDQFRADFQNEINNLEVSANSISVDEKLEEALSIKGSLDAGDNIKKLVDDYKNATTELEKESIAKKLQQQAPEMVKATGAIVDENGRLVKTYEIATDSVNEYAEKVDEVNNKKYDDTRNEIVEGLISEADKYVETSERVKKTAEDIDKAIKSGEAIDTTESEKQLNSLSAQSEKTKKEIIKDLAEASENGIDLSDGYEALAEKLGLSTDELQEAISLQTTLNQKAEEGTKQVESLADAWNNVNKQLNESITKSVSEINELKKRLQENKDISEEERKELELKLKSKKDETAELVRQQKNYNRINKQTQIQLGLKEAQKKEEKSITDIAFEKFSVEKNRLDLEKQKFDDLTEEKLLRGEIKTEEEAQNQISIKNLQTAEKQRQVLLQTLKDQKVIKDFDITTGTIEYFKISSKEMEKLQIERSKAIESLNKEFTDGTIDSQTELNRRIEETNSKFDSLEINLKPTEQQKIEDALLQLNSSVRQEQKKLEAIELDVVTKEKEVQEAIDELNNQVIDWQIQVGIINDDEAYKLRLERIKNDIVTFNQELETSNKDLAKKELELNELLNDETLDQDDNAVKVKRLLLKKQIADLRLANTTIKNNIQKSEQEIYNLTKDNNERRLNLISDYESRRIESINYEYDEQLQKLQEFNSKYLNNVSMRFDAEENLENSRASDYLARETKRLEELAERQVISARSLEDEKTRLAEFGEKKRLEIAEKYAKMRLVEQESAAGYESAIQTERIVKQAETEKQSAEQSIEIIKENNQGKEEIIEEYLKAQEQLLKAEQLLKVNEYNEEAKIEAERNKAILDEKLNGIDEADRETLARTAEKLTSAEQTLLEKGSELNNAVAELQNAGSSAIVSLIQGNEEQAEDAFRSLLANMVGRLQKLVEGQVLRLVLGSGVGNYLSALPFPANIAALATTQKIISATVKSATQPLFNKLLSFSSGGRVDEPTLAMIGDGSQLGNPNPEWILRDDQMIKVINEAVKQSRVENNYYGGEPTFIVHNEIIGEKILTSIRRLEAKENKRKR